MTSLYSLIFMLTNLYLYLISLPLSPKGGSAAYVDKPNLSIWLLSWASHALCLDLIHSVIPLYFLKLSLSSGFFFNLYRCPIPLIKKKTVNSPLAKEHTSSFLYRQMNYKRMHIFYLYTPYFSSLQLYEKLLTFPLHLNCLGQGPLYKCKRFFSTWPSLDLFMEKSRTPWTMPSSPSSSSFKSLIVDMFFSLWFNNVLLLPNILIPGSASIQTTVCPPTQLSVSVTLRLDPQPLCFLAP